MSIERLKKQAKLAQRVLPEFVAEHGTDLSLAKCQELVARLHGFPNWHAAQVNLSSGDASPGENGFAPPDIDLYVITIQGGVAHQTVAKGLSLALRGFLQEANMVASLFSNEDASIRFRGQEIDGGLPLLWLEIDGEAVVSLGRPGAFASQAVEDGKIVDKPLVPLPQLEGQPMAVVADRLTQAYNASSDRMKWNARRFGNSLAAHHLSTDWSAALMEVAGDSAKETDGVGVPLMRPQDLFKGIQDIRLLMHQIATIRG